MEHRSWRVGLTLAALLVTCVAFLGGGPPGARVGSLAEAEAANPGNHHNPHNPQVLHLLGTATGPISSFFIIPRTNPIASVQQTLEGTSNLLGAFQWLDKHTLHLDPTVPYFKPLRFTDGIGVVQSKESSDALFIEWSGVEKADEVAGHRGSDDRFNVTGGRGRFACAYGAGSISTDLNLAANTITVEFDGTVIIPPRKQ